MSVALVVGAGDGTGAAIAKRFAREGLTVCVARRNEIALESLVEEVEDAGGSATALAFDATEEAAVIDAFDRVERDVGPLSALVDNSAIITRGSILELSAEKYRGDWNVCAFGAFFCGREGARRMVPRGEGTISSPEPPPPNGAARISRLLPAENSHCAHSRNRWPESSVSGAFT